MSDALERFVEGFSIRPMSAADIDAVMAVEEASYESPWPRVVFLRELSNDWSHIELIVTEEGARQTVGHVVYWIVHDELHILNVAVHPEVRRRGLGRAFLERLMRVCARERLQYITLEVRVGNMAAIALYESFGFKRIGHRRRYYADNGEDALVMARVLEDSQD